MIPYIFDTETTGIDPTNDQIIEAAWLELPETPALFVEQDPKDLPHYCERFRATVPINLGAQAVHHIIASDLARCRESSKFDLPDDAGYLIGHNIDFDWRMSGEPGVKRICTLAISRFLFPTKDSHTQSAMLYLMARRGNWEDAARQMLRNAHAALDDVRNCSRVLTFLLQEAVVQGYPVSTWEEVHQLSETARIPTVMGFGKHKGTPIAQVDPGYVRWYRKQTETDPHYLEAFRRAGF